ncbi:MAG: hypothetical protein JW924_03345 [Fusobacteriaceae bacterium]|nr:hypothetical protein [Fusobacteriaceae bacterium]
MNIYAFFTDNGEPKTGLTPTIQIRRTDTGAVVINWATMIEVGTGWYKYEFTEDESLQYLVVCDGGIALTTAERYTFAGTELQSHLTPLEEIIKRILGLTQENFRILDATYETINEQECLKTATIKIYPSASDVDTDTNAIATYSLTATYNSQAVVTDYRMKRVS